MDFSLVHKGVAHIVGAQRCSLYIDFSLVHKGVAMAAPPVAAWWLPTLGEGAPQDWGRTWEDLGECPHGLWD